MAARADYVRLARQYAKGYGLDPNVFVRQIQQESGFNPNARSPAGALGIAQFMPGTARGEGVNPLNPTQALKGAARLMASYVHKYGSYKDALVAYNAGPGKVGQKLPAETVNYVNSILGGKNPSPSGASGSQSRSASSGATATVQDNPQVALALQKLLSAPSDPAPQPASMPPPTANIAQTVLPQGYTPPPQAQVQPSPQSTAVDQLLQVAASIPPSQVKVSGGGGGSAPSSSAPSMSGAGTSPLAKRGKIIGTPGVGTHTLGNWQSDNAIDIAVPVGTPVYANHSGVITRAGQLPGGGASGGGRFAGSRVQIGDEAWYGHLSKLTVKQGQKVKAGQLIGYSGAANGVAHLHFATRSGDPRRYYK